MIPAKMRYKTHNGKLLAIIEIFKTWYHYLEGYKHKLLVFTNHNNLHQFIDIKSLSFCQIRWAQKLSWYYSQIDYCQGKANRAADMLSCFYQKKQIKNDEILTENTRILHKLQSLLTNASFSGFSTLVKLLTFY